MSIGGIVRSHKASNCLWLEALCACGRYFFGSSGISVGEPVCVQIRTPFLLFAKHKPP
ncbi:protein of unknown function [Candidatus Methylomirabilis oxygeniifera]|uniref:Uncharacterized protein n=1 Tax=Methylomirabilis oxygeniifera TaxID=671143 RepID=D5MII5_METO1|nr:protein of unknown function [Candidatus Methylomirabilis oxyfera]